MEIQKVIEQENTIEFRTFTNDLALEIVIEINNFVKKNYDKPVGIKIVFDEKEVIKFLMQGRKTSPWLEKKANTVLESGHSSLFVFYNKDKKEYQKLNEDENFEISGGGFPIKMNGNIRGVICVSGLDHISDHLVITKVLSKILNIIE
jgi:uncharacterized protein (UPF0303 family)